MMDEPTLIIVGGQNRPERRRRGRPVGSTSASEPKSSVSAWVPEQLHDKAIEIAAKREISISKLICEALSLVIGVDDK